jgi:prepilin-type N-terminal cleavage/methylation domain-containing protein
MTPCVKHNSRDIRTDFKIAAQRKIRHPREDGGLFKTLENMDSRRRGNDGKISSKNGVIAKHMSGFTLLELTISIALIGIIVLIITGAMRLGTRAIESGEKRIAYLERTRSSLNIIDSQIQSYIPLVYIENGEKKYYFRGDRVSLEFSTNYSIWGGQKGYVIVTYSVRPLDNGKQAIYASETVAGRRNKVETMLTNPFETIYFEYFSKDPTEEAGKWMDQWTDNTSITGTDKPPVPQKIKIHFIEGAEDLALVLPVRVKMSAADLAAAGGFEEEFIAGE